MSPKRKTVKVKCPNPLFETWLREWKEDAANKNSGLQYGFGKALNSLKKYPISLKSGKECLILDHFGTNICLKLDRRLAEYRRTHKGSEFTGAPVYDATNFGCATHITPQVKKPKKQKDKHLTPSKKSKAGSSDSSTVYVPAWRSGAHALLVALFENASKSDGLSKVQLVNAAQPHCDASFKKPLPGGFYTAWSSMATLTKKGLVNRKGLPHRFNLTEAGVQLAKQLVDGEVPVAEKVADNILVIGETVAPNEKDGDIVIMEETASQLSSQHASIRTRPESVKSSFLLPSCVETKLSQRSSSQLFTSEQESLVFTPDTFKVILLVDIHETTGNQREADATMQELKKNGVSFEIRHLKVGDFAWVCRHVISGEELMLPYIVERKRMDDLGKSVKDGRFHEQKFRLKQCGLANPIYLVEDHGSNAHCGLPLTSLLQSAVNTQVCDGFTVKCTSSHADSMRYLACLTAILSDIFQNKTLLSCDKSDLPIYNVNTNPISLTTFKSFNRSTAKSRNFHVHEMFIRHLLQLHGLSVEKALAIVGRYPSPRSLISAYKAAGTAGEKLLAPITFGMLERKIGPVISKAIYELYTSSTLL